MATTATRPRGIGPLRRGAGRTRSGFERDRRLHDYLRGLLWMARSRPESAVVAFRRGITSETEGYSRLDLELARALLSLHRPLEAIPVLEHPLRGSLDAGNLYASRTELQEALAQAFDAAGQRDSAAVYYRDAIHAWSEADPQFQTRVGTAAARLAVDEKMRGVRRWAPARPPIAHRGPSSSR